MHLLKTVKFCVTCQKIVLQLLKNDSSHLSRCVHVKASNEIRFSFLLVAKCLGENFRCRRRDTTYLCNRSVCRPTNKHRLLLLFHKVQRLTV